LPGAVSVSLAREPDWFVAARAEGERHQTIVVRDAASGRLLGAGTRSVRPYFVRGRAVLLPYLGALRADRAARGRLELLRAGYAFCRTLGRGDEAPFALTSIVDDNERARRLLGCGRAGLPAYREAERFITLLIPTRGRARSHGAVAVERATANDLDEIAALLQRLYRGFRFAPCWSAEELACPQRTPGLGARDFLVVRARGAIVGGLAVWDQRRFKQVLVHGYAHRLRVARPWLNLLAPLIGTPRLPPPGARLEHAFLSHVAADDPAVLVGLIEAGRREARRRGCEAVAVGLSQRHPLLAAVCRSFPHRSYPSILYEVAWDGSAGSRGAPGRERGLCGEGPAHVEVATL